ncbi:MAG TPA: uracil phosphoribosyltransferase [Thermodesulfobacteriota bacterium]|nr:uracil phosphoribosyltransferase [Thermodesulfobacteriota bacterium]
MGASFRLVEHPLVEHKLTLLRSRETSTRKFREGLEEISILLGYEALRDLPLEEIGIITPLEATRARRLAGKKLTLVPVLRAGLGMVEGMLRLVPSARVGHIGIYRDEATLEAVRYYGKLPGDLEARRVLVLDPMLATGASACAAIEFVKQAGARQITFVCVIAAPEGVERLAAQHPDVPVLAAALDRQLDERGYIRPGLGDAGDRLFGTKGT